MTTSQAFSTDYEIILPQSADELVTALTLGGQYTTIQDSIGNFSMTGRGTGRSEEERRKSRNAAVEKFRVKEKREKEERERRLEELRTEIPDREQRIAVCIQVYPGISRYFQVFPDMYTGIYSYFQVNPGISRYAKIGETGPVESLKEQVNERIRVASQYSRASRTE